MAPIKMTKLIEAKPSMIKLNMNKLIIIKLIMDKPTKSFK
jgi:hypothetical protein